MWTLYISYILCHELMGEKKKSKKDTHKGFLWEKFFYSSGCLQICTQTDYFFDFQSLPLSQLQVYFAQYLINHRFSNCAISQTLLSDTAGETGNTKANLGNKTQPGMLYKL